MQCYDLMCVEDQLGEIIDQFNSFLWGKERERVWNHTMVKIIN